MKSFAKGFGIGILIILGVLALLGYLWCVWAFSAWLFSLLYQWFLIPVGFPVLSSYSLLGAILCISWIFHFSRSTKIDTKDKSKAQIAGTVIGALIQPFIDGLCVLFFAWLFMSWFL